METLTSTQNPGVKTLRDRLFRISNYVVVTMTHGEAILTITCTDVDSARALAKLINDSVTGVELDSEEI